MHCFLKQENLSFPMSVNKSDIENVIMDKTIAFIIGQVEFTENLGISFLSAVAKQRDWRTELIVFDQGTIDDEMLRIQPDIVAYNVMSANISVYRDINRYLKSKFDFISIMGGPHPTFYPDVRFEQGIDFICRGEGELAFGKFLDKFELNDNLDDIENLGSSEFLNPMGLLVRDLDTLPYPDRDLTFTKTDIGQSPMKVFMVTRGCPFICSYCYNEPLNEMKKGLGKIYRRFSPERIVTEINDVRSKYPLSFIKFQDDLFLPNNSQLEEFCRIYKKEVGLPFNALDRLDYTTKERLGIFKDANCVSLSFAIDSANPRIRNQILDRRMKLNNEEIINRLRLVNDYGINTLTAFMHACPTSKIQDEIDAVTINARGKVTFGASTTLLPYPGTAIYKYCVEHNLLDKHVEDTQFSSIQQRSILTSFSEKEKDVLLNIATLFATMSTVSWLRHILIFLARHVKPNFLFIWLFTIVKGYKMDRYIYPTGMPVIKKVGFFLKAFKIENSRVRGKTKEALSDFDTACLEDAPDTCKSNNGNEKKS